MELTELFVSELDRETERSRRALEQVPAGKHDWKPHEKSMELGYLSGLTATMLSWVAAIIELDHLDLASPGEFGSGAFDTNKELLEAFDKAVDRAKKALANTTDEHLLNTTWQLRVQGQTVMEQPRYVAIRDSVINHMAHHRGQLTVYLRLNDRTVPAIYGPSADDQQFA